MKNIYKEKFYKAVDCLRRGQDTVVKNEYGVIEEVGVGLQDGQYITYHLENHTINFWTPTEILLCIEEGSPLISMFEALIYFMNEDY